MGESNWPEGSQAMNPKFIAQARLLAKQMKMHRKAGRLDLAKRLEDTISVLNSYGQRRNK